MNIAESPCVIWAGSLSAKGYPIAGSSLMHRAALALKLNRPVGSFLDACHTCDNRACVNPEHLYEGPRRQNMADCSARDRHNKPRGESHWRAKLSAEQVLEIRALSADGWSRKSLGEKYGVHPATVSRIARGERRTQERPMHQPDYTTGISA